MGLLSKAKERREYGEYVVEGIRMVSEVPSSDLVKIYISESFSKNCEYKYDKAITEVVSDNVYNHMSDTKTPQGIMAVVKMKRYTLSDVLGKDRKGSAPLVLCVENLQDPGNLGTIIRTADALGCTGVVCLEGTVDMFSDKVVRSSMGSIFNIPFLDNVSRSAFIDACHDNELNMIATALDKMALKHYLAEYNSPTAIVFGNEGSGISAEIMEAASSKVYIPMSGKAESLNVASAAAIVLYEASRQRAIL